jgi:hypothetical protein
VIHSLKEKQMQPTSQHSETSWLRQGLIFGLLLGLIQVTFWLITFAIPLVPIRSGVELLLVPLLSFVGGLVAGLRVSRQTGKMSAGLLAGLITGLFAGIIFLIVSFIYVTAQLYSTGYRVNPLSFFQSPVALSLISHHLLSALIGGVIGGAVGRERQNYRV